MLVLNGPPIRFERIRKHKKSSNTLETRLINAREAWQRLGKHKKYSNTLKITRTTINESFLLSRVCWKFISKGSKNGANIDAQTYQISMPKQEPKKIRNIMNIMLFPIGTIKQIHYTIVKNKVLHSERANREFIEQNIPIDDKENNISNGT